MTANIYRCMLDEDGKNVLVKEYGRRYPAGTLDSPGEIRRMMETFFKLNEAAEEYVYLLAFDSRNRPIGIFEISHGSACASMANTREVFVRLCLCGAVTFVLVHNHPSGDPDPSGDDRNVTKKMISAGKLMGIQLMDHIITAREGYYSFRERENGLWGKG